MLFKHKHHLNEMRRHGRRAMGEIISIKTVGEGKASTSRWALDEDPGGSVPVWYQPGDTSRVVVDHEADLAGEMHWMADAERLAHRHDERTGLVWSPMGNDLVPFVHR